MARNASAHTRAEILSPKFLLLLNDSNRLISGVAIRQLGPFIATFADPKKTGVELRDGRIIQVKLNDFEKSSKEETFILEEKVTEGVRIPKIIENMEEKPYRSSLTLSRFRSRDDLTLLSSSHDETVLEFNGRHESDENEEVELKDSEEDELKR